MVKGDRFIRKMSDVLTLNYHSCDFDYNSWAREASTTNILPAICSNRYQSKSSHENVAERKHWESFFRNHNTGNFFRPRNYLFSEFRSWLSKPNPQDGHDSLTVVEVGCGHGCSMYPLIENLPYLTKYIATDYSSNALEILKEHSSYDKSRIQTALWDLSLPPDTTETFQSLSDIVICVFALSAVEPEHHITALKNMGLILKPNGKILFRDYGLHDMTMYRHTTRLSEKLFERNDRTLAYYFDLEYFREIVSKSGFTVLELEYATVEVRNRKMENCMKRVFLHAVIQKKADD